MRYSMNNILADDPLNLLQVVKKFSGQKTETERLIGAFEEINEFFVEHKRAPQKSKEDIIEFPPPPPPPLPVVCRRYKAMLINSQL